MSHYPIDDEDITIDFDFIDGDHNHYTVGLARFEVVDLDYSKHVHLLGWGGSRVSIKNPTHALAMLDIIEEQKSLIETVIRAGHEALRLGHIHYGEEV